MGKVKFNHDLDSVTEACGIEVQEIDKKYEDFVNILNAKITGDTQYKASFAVELMLESFSKVEIAYIAVQKIIAEASNSKRGSVKDILELLISKV